MKTWLPKFCITFTQRLSVLFAHWENPRAWLPKTCAAWALSSPSAVTLLSPVPEQNNPGKRWDNGIRDKCAADQRLRGEDKASSPWKHSHCRPGLLPADNLPEPLANWGSIIFPGWSHAAGRTMVCVSISHSGSNLAPRGGFFSPQIYLYWPLHGISHFSFCLRSHRL